MVGKSYQQSNALLDIKSYSINISLQTRIDQWIVWKVQETNGFLARGVNTPLSRLFYRSHLRHPMLMNRLTIAYLLLFYVQVLLSVFLLLVLSFCTRKSHFEIVIRSKRESVST